MKLKTKIILFSSLFMLLITLAGNLSIYYFFYTMSTRTELDELTLVINDITQALNQNPDVDPRDMLQAYLPASGMIRIVLESEVPMLEQTRSSHYTTLPWRYTTMESQAIVAKQDAPPIAVVEKPIIWRSGEHAGEVVTIQVSNHLIPLQETMRLLFYVLALLTLIALIPIGIGSSLLSRFLLRPIQTLIQTMNDNRLHGKWKKIAVRKQSKDELYEMESTFNQMIEHLEASYEKQEAFVSDASHELKTPIQIIKSYAQLIERRGHGNPSIIQESVLAIDSEADRMKGLVEQMLTLAKNKQLHHKVRVNLAEEIDEVIRVFDGVTDRTIQVEQGDPSIPVNADPGQLKQLLYILLDNALKYSPADIDVRLYRESAQAVVEVQDYGPGIAPKDQARIFDRFYRVDKARNRDTGGTGLGLAIAKSIVDVHAGEIAVISEPNEGSTFIVKLPIAAAAAME